MKILKIAFKNINSLQGQHEIDFQKEPFYSNNLFAITGPTGSGKTTILDVIVLALFNEIPRIGRISKAEIEGKGAILTRGQKEAFAKVTYSCTKGIFTSEWSISTARTGNLRDYEMFVSDAQTGEFLVSKKSEVPSKNEELIGLKYDQFVKSVLLAQGAFAEFLRVPKKERSAILEKITGMVVYRKLGMKAYDKYRTVKNTIEDLEKEVKSWQNELLPADKISELRREYKTSKELLSEFIKREAEGKKKIDHKDKIEIEKNKLDSWVKKGELNAKAISKFQENEGVALEKHKLLEPIQQNLVEWKRLNIEKSKLEKQFQMSKDELLKLNTKKTSFNKQISDLLNDKVSESNYEIALAEFERKVLNLKNTYNAKVEKGKALKNEIQADIRPIGLKLDANYEEVQIEIEKFISNAKAFFAENKTILNLTNDFDTKINIVQGELEQLQKAKSTALEISHLQKRSIEIKNELSKLEEAIADLPSKIQIQESENTLAKSQLKNLELTLTNQKLMSSLEEHRADLQNGKPCPLCGALDHPFAEGIPKPENENLKFQIKEQEEKVQMLSKGLNQLQTILNLKQQDIQKYKNELYKIDRNTKEAIEKYEKQFEFSINTDWDKEIEQVKSEIQLYQQAHKHKVKLDISNLVLPKLEEVRTILKESVQLKSEIKLLYDKEEPVENVVNNLEKEWREIQTRLALLTNKKDGEEIDLKENMSKIQPLTRTIELHISDLDFNNISDALEALLDYKQLQTLEKQRESLLQEKNEIQINKSAIREILEELEQLDVDESVEMLKQTLIANQAHIKQIQKELEEHTIILRNQEIYHQKIQQLKLKIKDEKRLSKHWRMLNDLIGDATGNKFNTFAQDLTLQQLLQLANKRLALLSDRYLVANPQKDEDDSLVVIDKDMGGQRRSVKTLSGGETFVISLALALALSDLASNKVKIQSLFIDEGFGTLDPETLDQTLNTLEQLQEEGSKMIGIISHVASLKERITTQIQVTPNGRGFSTLEVVG